MDPHSQRLWRVSAMDEVEITADDTRRARRAYFGAIAYVDDHLGELMATLSALGLADDTVVVFTSDHGDLLGERGLWYKMCFFEWAVRVPLIVTAPIRFAPRRSAAPVSHLDLLATLLELGAPEPGWRTDLACDGASLVPYLEGRPSKARPVLGEYLAEGALAPIFMIRRGRHKFIWSEPDPPMLFDMENDPDELLNLAQRPEHAELVRAFETEVREH